MTGMEIIGRHNFGSVGGAMRKDIVDSHRQEVARRARRIVDVYRRA